ncbi:hypothetical protein ACP275_09G049600 [Erythranthe tilingii]
MNNPSESAKEAVLRRFLLGESLIGWRFKPTDEELLSYLAMKSASGSLPFEVIPEIPAAYFFDDHPKNLVKNQTKDNEGSASDKEWHFFIDGDEYFEGEIVKDRKVGQGIGSWRSVGREDAVIGQDGKVIGYKYLSTYFTTAENSSRPKQTLWEMHKYRLNAEQVNNLSAPVKRCVAARISRRDTKASCMD